MAALGLVAWAQTSTKPVAKLYSFDDGGYVQQLSDNGLWAAIAGSSSEDATNMVGARILNMQTGQSRSLLEGLNTDTVFSSAVYDVTNDGQVAVGQINGHPAYYSALESKWIVLPVSQGASGGQAVSVTPDGRYAVGVLGSAASEYKESVALWNLTTGQLMDTPGIPTKDMAHEDKGQNRFTQISADGTKILGVMSFSFLPTNNDLGGCFAYVYDVTAQTYAPIGFIETTSGRWTALADGLFYIPDSYMSNNGKWVTGDAYMVKSSGDSDYGSEYEVPFLYNTETGDLTVYDDDESTDHYGFSVDNEGHVYAASPASNPYRDFGVRAGKYWVDFKQALEQKWGYNIFTRLGIENSGTPICVTDDGLTLASDVGDDQCFVVTLPETFPSVAAETNLLSSYSVSPANNSNISKLSTLAVTFTRDVQVVGDAQDVTITNMPTGEKLTNAVGFKADGKTVTLTFRKATFSAAELYNVVIPAKAICLQGDATRTNSEIKLTYVGREEKPLTVVSVSPKDASAVGKIDLSTSPITLTFDTDVMLANTSSRALLYQGESTDAFAQLLMAADGKKLLLYPSTTQYLYKDVEYRVELPAGVVTDITGNANTANESYTLHYKGAYEREISYDENVLFEDDFSNGVTKFLVLDNDKNTPSSASQQIGFTSSQYGWMPVRSTSSSSNFAAASTSMYTPAGKSDDWMVIPLLNIPDQLCKLTFKSQSYRKSASDRLKIYVWETNNYYNALSSDIIEKLRAEATLVYDELQTPGEEEETLEGDWRDNTVSLKSFAGKNIYIAFLNDNEDQSAVFVDDVKVLHELPFYVAITSESTVVAQTEVAIEGVIDVRDENKTYTDVQLSLQNAHGETVDEITESGLSLKKGDIYDFSFIKKLPLTVGLATDYTVLVKLNDDENSVQKKVESLAFEPVKRIVLEEFTGTDCTNCPLGIEVINRLQNYYGDLFIPLALHCYTGDPFSTGVSSYASFLNLTAAPSGVIQRSGTISYPMVQLDGTYYVNAPEGEDALWMDIVADELNTPAAAEVTATATLKNNLYTVPVNVRYALSATDLNLKVLAVVLENGLTSYQKNNYYGVSSDALGEWGKGGKYATSVVSPYTFDHVVRGWDGTTFTGTPEVLPTEMDAGETYTCELCFDVPETVSKSENTEIVVMLFDGNTDKLINACRVVPTLPEGIGNATVTDASSISVRPMKGGIVVNSSAEAAVQVFAVDGRSIASANGSGTLAFSLPAYHGVAIVRVTTKQGIAIKKAIIE